MGTLIWALVGPLVWALMGPLVWALTLVWALVAPPGLGPIRQMYEAVLMTCFA
jgi:hypothetical protein